MRGDRAKTYSLDLDAMIGGSMIAMIFFQRDWLSPVNDVGDHEPLPFFNRAATGSLEHDPEKWVPVFPRDKR